ncbi:hyporthetical protein [Blumeria hordei DH14]|uniref:Hyporthetical protein n=1 Tax=Blumeria graminis f. sp. hordei (strain DH14) TaxID=546991 RepID=N1JBQ0_BLUG1|nr:hyporthetical protein [Blumeria hordei DH14]
MLDKIHRDVRRMLRILLRRGGINTGSIRAGIARQLAAVLQFEELPEWNDNDLVTTKLLSKSRFYQKKLRLLNSTDSQATQPQPTTTRIEPDTIRRPPRVSYQAPATQNVVYEQPEPSYKSAREIHQPQPQPQPRFNPSRASSAYPPVPFYKQPPVFQTFQNDPYADLPHRNVPNERLEPSAVINFAKQWNKKTNFHGLIYEVFDDNVNQFLRACELLELLSRRDLFADAYIKIKVHFDTDANCQVYLQEWQTVMFASVKNENPDKDLRDVLDILFDKLSICQRAIGNSYEGDNKLRDQILRAYRQSTELAPAIDKPAGDPEELMANLRSTIINHTFASQFVSHGDARFNFQKKGKNWKTECYICRKEGCWSTKHTDDKQRRMRNQFITQPEVDSIIPTAQSMAVFLVEFEGQEPTGQYLTEVILTSDNSEDYDIGFILGLVKEKPHNNMQFDIQGTLIHWSSTKCEQVTQSVLASEIYGMVYGFDIGLSIATTFRMIAEQLGLPSLPLVICTDFCSLYECLVKLGTTKEKRLMIDIMALCESYQRREITEICWINDEDNPADAMTKAMPNKALQRFIDSNELLICVESFMQR